jgi:SNF2 family DNA or RNA helicase
VKAERAFNEDPAVRVIILLTRSVSESANLQKGGNIQVFIDVVSYRVVAQCIGRIYRVGQEREIFVYILSVDETFDQALLSRY